ncbi:fibronectin type III domain-containing protein [Gemmatimonadota bacterium]
MKFAKIYLILAFLFTAACQASPGADSGFFERHWSYVSETSAVIYWQLGDISQSALSYVEYGETRSLGERTDETKKPRWSQFHRLTGLKPGGTYYYRMVVTDPETDGTTVSEILTLATDQKTGAVRIPQEVTGPPYILDRPDTYYILTEDITVPGSAFEIGADNITLDLDGHTAVFGNDTAERVFGVRFTYGENCRLVNGHLVQGARSNLYSSAVASLDRPQGTEVCGISTDVHLKCAYPMNFTHIMKAHIHHNNIYSRVTELECRHYPGNVLMRFYVYSGDVHIHDNLLTEGCHWGIMVREKNRRTMRNVEVDHNDIQHHQQYVNGYALAPGSGAEVHHNKVTSTGRAVHITGEGTVFHDNYIDTRGHMHLSDLPARTRPFHHRLIELHGVKFEGSRTKNCKIFNNFVRITQSPPRDSDGQGDPRDKVDNGVYVRSQADRIAKDRLVDSKASWEPDRWRFYWVKYSPDLPPVQITGNDSVTLHADFQQGVTPAEYTIYMKWEYVPPTPLNIACYDPNGMNEVYNNRFIGITHYNKTRHGDYGDSGKWATAVMFVGMNRGPAETGKYSVYVHDNQFESNDLFLNSYVEIDMNVRIENNTFTLRESPLVTERTSRMRNLGPALEKSVLESGNTFNE